MKNQTYIVFVLAFLLSTNILSQDQDKKFKTEWGGLIWAESFIDTRETVNVREGEILLYPKRVVLDKNGNDIYRNTTFNMVNIHSRASLKASAPDVFGAKVSGLLEMDFVGSANNQIGLVRIRHAMIKLAWENSDLIFGQYWHPIFDPESFPRVVSPALSIPFYPLSRNAQIRYTYRLSNSLSVAATALTQLDFKSPGPDGYSTKYLRDSGIPELNANVKYRPNSTFMIGASIGRKVLKPMLFLTENGVTSKCYETIASYQMNMFSKVDTRFATLRFGAVYGQNLANFVMMGGYGVTGNNADGEAQYTNLASGTVYFDLISAKIKEKVSIGMFFGYAENFGSQDVIVGPVYGRGTDIKNSYRIAPRIVFHKNNLRFRLEASYDSASYGDPNEYYVVENIELAGNTRLLFATTLEF